MKYTLCVFLTILTCVLSLLQTDLHLRENKLHYAIETEYLKDMGEFILRKNDWFNFTVYSDSKQLEIRFGNKLEDLFGQFLVVPLNSPEQVILRTFIDQNSFEWPTKNWYALIEKNETVNYARCFIPLNAPFGNYYLFVTNGREIHFNLTQLSIKARKK